MSLIRTRGLIGLDPYEVTIEASWERRSPELQISGLPDHPTRETRVRVAATLAANGHTGPFPEIVVSGYIGGPSAHFDLAIAAACIEERIAPDGETLFGELSLAGEVRQVRGMLPLLAGCDAPIVIPEANRAEVSRVRAGLAIDTFSDLCISCGGRRFFASAPEIAFPERETLGIVLVGAPGAGKTLIARSIAMGLGFRPNAETDAIYSAAGLLPDVGSVSRAPFRAPHHTVSKAGLVGGGEHVRPGEVSLAHRGVLFLDEFTDFRQDALDSLFRAFRHGRVVIHRKGRDHSIPAKPAIVVAAAEESARLEQYLALYPLSPVPIEKGYLARRAIAQAAVRNGGAR